MIFVYFRNVYLCFIPNQYFCVQAYVSVKRINKFMNMEELDPNNVQHDPSERKCKICVFFPF